MFCTASLLEVDKIVNTNHKDPHHILGMHLVEINNVSTIVVRVFNPQANAIKVIDVKKPSKKWEMKMIHWDGFFEAVITGVSDFFQYELEIAYENNVTVKTHDTYATPQIWSDVDLHLFGEGTHYDIFKKMGSHAVEINGVNGVKFSLWAPNAARVSVIGDFNSWDGRRNPMRGIDNSGIWELFIPHIGNLEKYKYEIKTKEGDIFEKTDPYGNFFESRPSTCALVYDINNYTWNDSKWLKKREKNNPIDGPINIYEVHLGSWKRVAEDGNRYLSYKELADDLIKYVKEMGYNYIELMPVEEYPYDGSWGYQVTGYFAPTSRYGSPDEFMYFIDKCHENDIGVILDWVPAHFPKDSHGLYRFDGSALYEHSNPAQGEHPDWGTCIFNYGRQEVKNFLIGNVLFWLEQYHLDGIRVDAVASMLYLDYGKEPGQWVPNRYGGRENLEAIEFMKHMNSVVLGRNPHYLMIAEESTAWPGVSRPAEQDGLGFNLKWNMGWMNDFLQYVRKDSVYKKYHHYNMTFSMVYAYTENFVLVLSHDEVVHGKGSMINKMPGDSWQKFANLRVTYGYMFSHPGKNLIFMGNEFGQFSEWSEARSLDWHLLEYDTHKKMQAYMKALNNMYLKEKAFWEYDFSEQGFEWINANDEERSVFSFVRKTENIKDTLVIVCNFTPATYIENRIGVPLEGEYKEIFNSDNTEYGGSGVINKTKLVSEKKPWDGRENSVGLAIPPLGVVVLKYTQAVKSK